MNNNVRLLNYINEKKISCEVVELYYDVIFRDSHLGSHINNVIP